MNSRMEQVVAGSVNAATVFVEAANFAAADVGTLNLSDSFSVPTLTTTQRDALSATNGMVVYNTSTNKFQGYEAGSWSNLI